MITRYGYNVVTIVTIITFILIGISFWVNSSILRYILIIAPAIFFLFTLYFFRDPQRITPKEENAIFSPADGKIIIISEIEDTSFIKEKVTKVSIFMSPLNVHVNRIPIDGKVEYVKYNEGEFSAAFLDKASEKNERSTVGLSTKSGKIMFTQIAGAIARRIVNTLSVGQEVKAGQKYGMIKFGSRVDILLPKNAKLNVKLEQKVTAGETIIAWFK